MVVEAGGGLGCGDGAAVVVGVAPSSREHAAKVTTAPTDVAATPAARNAERRFICLVIAETVPSSTPSALCI